MKFTLAIMLTMAAMFGGGFTLYSALRTAGRLSFRRWGIRVVLAVLILYSTIVRNFVYPRGTVAPSWFSPILDVLYIIVSVLLVVVAWKLPTDRRRHGR